MKKNLLALALLATTIAGASTMGQAQAQPLPHRRGGHLGMYASARRGRLAAAFVRQPIPLSSISLLSILYVILETCI